MEAITQRVAGAGWRALGRAPPNAGIRGASALRANLAAPSLRSGARAPSDDGEHVRAAGYRASGETWAARKQRRRIAKGKTQVSKGAGKRAQVRGKK